MAKRARRPKGTLAALVRKLESLDAERRAVIAGIRAATESLLGGGGTTGGDTVRSTGNRRRGGRRKGFTLSAEARAKIAAAQKRRWAAQRKKAEKE
jgi:hypothetical protein